MGQGNNEKEQSETEIVEKEEEVISDKANFFLKKESTEDKTGQKGKESNEKVDGEIDKSASFFIPEIDQNI